MAGGVFISYSHQDVAHTNWLERLQRYLGAFERRGTLDVWDDTRLRAGQEWRKAIQEALDAATVAVLLVGPGFLASEFITTHELPPLLDAARHHGKKILPVIIGYCAYERSELAAYQAVNSPDKPLEALQPFEQNRILNDLSIVVWDEVHRSSEALRASMAPARPTLDASARLILTSLRDTYTAFQAQVRRRDLLVHAVGRRLGSDEVLEYERFFFRHYSQMNAEEMFDFEQIRAVTEGTLHNRNAQIRQILDDHPALLEAVPALTDLREHLVFWLNKYERVFLRTKEMCVLYTGVEDGVPFPHGVEQQIRAWLDRQRASGRAD